MATKTFAWPPRNDHLLLIYADEVLIRQFISLSRLVYLGLKCRHLFVKQTWVAIANKRVRNKISKVIHFSYLSILYSIHLHLDDFFILKMISYKLCLVFAIISFANGGITIPKENCRLD